MPTTSPFPWLPCIQVLLHPSQANRRTDTFDGIDVCGQRLADEMRQVVARHPSLERISVIGHSMGEYLLGSCLDHRQAMYTMAANYLHSIVITCFLPDASGRWPHPEVRCCPAVQPAGQHHRWSHTYTLCHVGHPTLRLRRAGRGTGEHGAGRGGGEGGDGGGEGREARHR